MLILSLHSGPHDSAAALFDEYNLVAAVSEERLNRKKCSGGFPEASIGEVLRIANVRKEDVDIIVSTRSFFQRRYFTHWRFYEKIREQIRHISGNDKTREMNVVLSKDTSRCAHDIFDSALFLADNGFRPNTRIFFSNHHFSHALPSLFFTDWDNALLYTADGSGDQVYYSHTLLKDGALTNLYGDDRWLGKTSMSGSIGLAYGFVTEALGWKMNRHEGKLTGLAGHGTPTLLKQMQKHFCVQDDGRIEMDFANHAAMRTRFQELAKSDRPENAAASIQALLEDTIFQSTTRLIERHGVRHLGLAGGVFANVRLNRHLAENLPIDEVFIVPPMGDDGLVIGGALQFLLERDGLQSWMKNRRRISNVYWGGDHDSQVTATFTAGGARRVDGDPIKTTADWLAQGRIGAIYHGRMEFGPRALGARTILASPANAGVNQSLNDRLDRSDFMPFAPVVTDADVNDVFELPSVSRYAASFMTVTCGVKDRWRDHIPAVVHVDGTARPQVIRRDDNALYFDILEAFKAASGLPVLVNTSFNVHEEPIINRPEECLRALKEKRVDFVVTPEAVWLPE